MKLFLLFKQKITLSKRELTIGVQFVVTKILLFLSFVFGLLYFMREVKYNITYFVAYLLLRFDEKLALISKYIIPHKEIILFPMFSIILLIASFYIIYKFTRLIKYFKYYASGIQVNIQKIKTIVITNANRDIFKKVHRGLSRYASNLAYDILIYIWDKVKYFPIFGNYKVVRKNIIENVRMVKKTFSPLMKFVLLIKTRTIVLFTKKNTTDKEESSFLLMDEGKQLTKIETIPSKIIELLSNDALVFQPIILKEWRIVIDEAISRWRSGNISSLIITGGAGSGKSTLLKYIRDKNQDSEVKYYKLNRKNNILENNFFVKLINTPFDQFDTIDKQIIIFDDVENLFLLMINGFEKIRKFFVLIERTKEKILWIVTANSSFFSFQNKIFPMKTIFQKHLLLDNFNDDFLLSVYENKLNSVGYEFNILKDKKIEREIKNNLKQKIIAKNEIGHFLRKNYFTACLDMGKSNFYFYNFYFLRSIKYAKGQRLFLTPPDFLEIPDLEERSSEELFILKTILIHKSITKEEIEEILLLPPDFVSLALSLFYENNLIQKNGENFTIYSPVYSQVVKFLKNKNLIE